MESILQAKDIQIGTQLAETDGFLFTVVEIIKETPKTITIRLCSDFSSVKNHWTIQPNGSKGGLIKTFRKTSKLYGIL